MSANCPWILLHRNRTSAIVKGVTAAQAETRAPIVRITRKRLIRAVRHRKAFYPI